MGIDVYIKNEGYADVKFLTDKAKNWAHNNEIPNGLLEILHDDETTFCGKPVWTPETKVGLYKTGVKLSCIPGLVKAMKSAGLKVESEIDVNCI